MGDEYPVKSWSNNHDCWIPQTICCVKSENMSGIVLVNVKCRVRGSVRFSEERHIEKQQLSKVMNLGENIYVLFTDSFLAELEFEYMWNYS